MVKGSPTSGYSGGRTGATSINKFWPWLNYITAGLLVVLEMANGHGSGSGCGEQPLRIRNVRERERERATAG